MPDLPPVPPLWRRCMACHSFITARVGSHHPTEWVAEDGSLECREPGGHQPGILVFDYPGEPLPAASDLEDD